MNKNIAKSKYYILIKDIIILFGTKINKSISKQSIFIKEIEKKILT